ncbi:trimeric LpxA-like protein [Lipomyces oligophaga]|uniref:trimeric LpxA-like protein n=1 Tax=Lipomyces oligophaga TaxID=45792 RepID=UPI0034CD8FCA
MSVNKQAFIETESGNRISRRAIIIGSQHILLGGCSTVMPGCVIRGDLFRPQSSSGSSLVAISLGRYVFLESEVLLRPAFKLYKGSLVYYPLKIGSFVTIGRESVIEAASIGSHVSIGENCVIGKFAIIKDCVVIRARTVIPATACIPPFSIVAGNPGMIVGTLADSAIEVFERQARQIHVLHGSVPDSESRDQIKSTVFDDSVGEEFDY